MSHPRPQHHPLVSQTAEHSLGGRRSASFLSRLRSAAAMRGLSQRRYVVLVCLLSAALTLLLFPLFFLPSPPSPSTNGPVALSLSRSVSRPGGLSAFESLASNVAWAIPVGGRTQRLDRLQSLLRDLIAGGAGRTNIYVFEDDGSRDQPSPALASIARLWGVTLLQSHVRRLTPEPYDLFGLHLARHYHYMMDTLLLPDDAAVLRSLSSRSETPHHLGYEYMVVLEDDLTLAPDAVHFFLAMSTVMQRDNSLLCVCAHADNAFYAATRSEMELLMLHHHPNAAADTEQQTQQQQVEESGQRSGVRSAEEAGLLLGLDGLDGLPLDDDDSEHSPSTSHSAASSRPRPRSPSSLLTLAASEFDFRRGQHFMAPGWMTSAAVYRAIRPDWFDSNLDLPHKSRLQMPNGNWDAFLDAQAFHRGLECIYPEIPRVAHVGANGYTVSAAMQAELFDNLRLSSLPTSIDYGDVSRLTLQQYDKQLLRFIERCTRVTSFDEMRLYRRSDLCLLLPTASDKDGLWVDLFSHYFGMVSVGGHANYGKQRGIHHGAAFTRWLTNLVLVIGAHGKLAAPFLHLHGGGEERRLLALLQSEYTATASERVLSTVSVASLGSSYVGCYLDDRSSRILPHFLASVSPVTPLRCMTACALRGYQLAGVEWGWECWCGQAAAVADGVGEFEETHSANTKVDLACDSQCVSNWEEKTRQAKLKEDGKQPSRAASPGCGGDFMLSIYRTVSGALTASGSLTEQQPATQASVGASLDFSRLILRPKAPHQLDSAFSDVSLVLADPGRSCDDTCANHRPTAACDDALLALIHDDCALLQRLMGCSRCEEPATPWDGFAAPGQERGSEKQWAGERDLLAIATTADRTTAAANLTDHRFQSRSRYRHGAHRRLLAASEDDSPAAASPNPGPPAFQAESAPATSASPVCVTSRGKYLRCSAVPRSPTFVRACVCSKETFGQLAAQ